jgi:hypothetical protein
MVETLNGSWQQRIAELLDDYFNNSPFSLQTADAFGRLRTADTGQRLDVEFIYDKQADYFDEITNNGTVTHNANTRDLTLSISDANNGTYSCMASHPIPYTPGNSQLIDITGVLDLSNIGGGNAEVFLRSSISGSVSEQVIEQSSWTNTVLDVDWSKSHIFQMSFQSLKVGTIQFLMVREGTPVKVAEIDNDNLRDSGYWQLPSLPIYYKIYNDATYTYMEMGYGNDDNAIGFRYKIAANASATMSAICCTAKSEGGGSLRDLAGLPRSIDSGIVTKTVSTTLVPLLSIRPKSTFLTFDNLILSIPKSFNVSSDNPIRLIIVHDCTLTGASWVNVDVNNSSMEYDVTASAFTGGHLVYSEYVTSNAKNTPSSGEGILGKTVLWNRKGTETGIFTIAAVRTTNTNANVLTSLQWDEIR